MGDGKGYPGLPGLIFGVGLNIIEPSLHPPPPPPSLQGQREAAECSGAVDQGPGEVRAEEEAAAGFPPAPGEGPAEVHEAYPRGCLRVRCCTNNCAPCRALYTLQSTFPHIMSLTLTSSLMGQALWL